jgi:hypothetical protein
VYEAVQVSVDRAVALKVMALATVEPDVERRFRAECRTVAELSWHPNVVALYDAGVTPEGLPFLAMELVRGGSWGDRIKADGPGGPRQVVKVGIQIVDALGAAHEAGILHRDIKPDNVLIGRRGEALLSDFGVATVSDASRSTTGDFAGTVAYSAPELMRNERATRASDVYAVGATLFTLAVGRSPFAGDPEHDSPAAIVFRIVSGDPPPIPEWVPPPLAHVIGQAIARDPQARYPSAAALEAALREIQPHVPTAPVRATPAAEFPADGLPAAVKNPPVGFDGGERPGTPTQAGLTPVPVTSGDGNAGTRSKRRGVVIGAAAGALAVLLVGLAVLALTRDGGESASSTTTADEEGSPRSTTTRESTTTSSTEVIPAGGFTIDGGASVEGSIDGEASNFHDLVVGDGEEVIVTISPVSAGLDVVVESEGMVFDDALAGEAETILMTGPLFATVEVSSFDGTPGEYTITLEDAGPTSTTSSSTSTPATTTTVESGGP